MNNTLNKKTMLYTVLCIAISIGIASCSQSPQKTGSADPINDTPLSQDTVSTDLDAADQKLFDLALSQLASGNLKKSRASFLKLAKRHPNHISTKANLANIAFQEGELDQAFAMARQISNIESSASYAHMLMGLISVKKGQLLDAEKYYLKSIESDDRYAAAHHNLALLYDIYFQHVEKAYVHYQRYLALIQGEDKETADWVEQLQYSLPNKGTE